MKILTFDTSTDIMYVTLSENGTVKESKILKNTENNYHTAFLIPVIIDLLNNQNMTMQDINAVGVNIGPGSFTGIRASAVVARVMGQNLNIPIVGTPSLEILSKINNTSKNSLCVLDARKNKAYIAEYDTEGNEVRKPQAMLVEDVINLIKNTDNYIITDNAMFKKLNEENINSLNYQDNEFDFGEFLAKLTYKKVTKSADYNWFNLKPLYIQPPPISMPKAVCK